MINWIKTSNRLPPDNWPVLIVRNGNVEIGELRWETPSWDETFAAFQYWDNPNDDGQRWDWVDITYWAEIPEPPPVEEVNQ